MNRVLLTGGNGFVGSHIVDRLVRDGAEVHAIANENHERLGSLLPEAQIHVLRQSPYAASGLVTRLAPDTIFHLAAVYEEPLSIDAVSDMVDGNLALGTALLYGASRCVKPAIFINTGTYWQYDHRGDYAPNTVYAATKQAFQDILFFYERKRFVSATTLLLYDTFGPGDTRSKLWAHLLRQPPGTTIELSDGHQLVELVAIDDVVAAFLRAAQLLEDGVTLEPVYSIRSASQHTLREMVEELNQRASLGLTLCWGRKPYWEGQVVLPWQGPLLPGWQPRQAAMETLVRLALARTPPAEIPENLQTSEDPHHTSASAHGLPA